MAKMFNKTFKIKPGKNHWQKKNQDDFFSVHPLEF